MLTFINFSKYLSRDEESSFLLQVMSLGIAYFITPVISNIYCRPLRSYAEVGESAFVEYVDNLEGYCYFYHDIYSGFFSSGNNSFLDLLIFTTLVFLIGLIIYILFSLNDYSKAKKKQKRLEDHFPIDVDEYPVLELYAGVKRLLGLFIATFIAIWAVGVLI